MSVQISIDSRSGYPIYMQIVGQIQRAIAFGVLVPGEQLPTVKQLSSDMLVNPSTVARAMRELEHLGLIVSRVGRGSFVAELPGGSITTNVANDVVAASLGAALREARELGVDARTVHELVASALTAAYGELAPRR